MQAPQRVTASKTYTNLSLQTLPSPVSDRGTMVILPSTPSSPRLISPRESTYTPIAHFPTPANPFSAEAEIRSSTQSKRNLKSHVASACANCKKAHLACDVSRPCKRCVSAGKADTCQDVRHKKRGRPRLTETKRLNSMYGGSMMSEGAGDEAYAMTRVSLSTMQTSRKISFVHEPIESFRTQKAPQRRKDLTIQNQVVFQQPQEPRSPLPHPLPQQLPRPLALLSPQSPHHQQRYSAAPPVHQLAPPSAARITVRTREAIVLFLSMEMCCARVNDEATALWGYDPNDLVHRSLYSLISSHDTDRLSRLHRLLLNNIIDVACQHDSSFLPDMQPPPSQRTTSPLFHETDPNQLCLTANGSSTFMDTLHIKKQSGEYELYEILVYLGAGLGADLTRTSTLDRLYVVAEFKKHQYKVKPKYTTTETTVNQQQQNQSSPQQSSPNKNGNNEHASLVQNRPQRPLALQFSRYGSIGGNNSNLLQVRQGSLPVHFSANCQMNTVSLPVARKSDVPKVNVAPMTGGKKGTTTTDRLFPSLGNGPQFHRVTAAASSTTTTAATSIANSSPIHVNPYSSVAYKFTPIVAGNIGSPHRPTPSITHPTTQYFLQTSSSTLNVAASAAQRNMQQSNNMAENVAQTESNRKAEMSVRSLLC